MSSTTVYSVAIGLIGLVLAMIAALSAALPAVVIVAGYGLMGAGTVGALTGAVLARLSAR